MAVVVQIVLPGTRKTIVRSRYATWFIFGVGIVAWLVIIARAASPSTNYVPVIANGPSPTPVNVQLIQLVNQDCGLVNAVATVDGRIFVDYTVRPASVVVTTEYIGGALIPRAASHTIAGVEPEGTLPGPKQGSVSQVVIGPVLYTFFTGRATDDTTGPFFLWVLIEPVPAKP